MGCYTFQAEHIIMLHSHHSDKIHPNTQKDGLTLHYRKNGAIFMFGNILRRAAARSAEGARSALRRGAPEARGRVSKRRKTSLSFWTLHHFPVLNPL